MEGNTSIKGFRNEGSFKTESMSLIPIVSAQLGDSGFKEILIFATKNTWIPDWMGFHQNFMSIKKASSKIKAMFNQEIRKFDTRF